MRFALLVSLFTLSACSGADYGFDLSATRACSVIPCSTCAKTDFVVDGSYRYDNCRYTGASADLPSPVGSSCSGGFAACSSSPDGNVYSVEVGPSGTAVSATMTSKYDSCSSTGDFQVWGVEHANSGGCAHDLYFVLHCTGGGSGATSYSCQRYIEVTAALNCGGVSLKQGDYYVQRLTLTRLPAASCG